MAIRDEINRGIKDPREIAENLGLNMHNMHRYRERLGRSGIKLPYIGSNYRKVDMEIKSEDASLVTV